MTTTKMHLNPIFLKHTPDTFSSVRLMNRLDPRSAYISIDQVAYLRSPTSDRLHLYRSEDQIAKSFTEQIAYDDPRLLA